MVKILVIGSTGKLGTKLLKFTNSKNISIYAITCYKNKKKLIKQASSQNIKNSFVLNDSQEFNSFLVFLKKNKFNIVYFLDYGSYSLTYLNIILSNNKKTLVAIANKELIIAGGKFLFEKFHKTNNYFIPLDSEHFSLLNSNINNDIVNKLYITASGGPFYFKKNINFNNVSLKNVISHPKWQMGLNNSIDSSNFINKVLEIFEASYIYNIDLKKINFLISREAYIHSVVQYKDSTISLNAFKNDMLLTLVKPLRNYFDIDIKKNIDYEIFNSSKLKLEYFEDKRYPIGKYLNFFKNLSHANQIDFMLLNNLAHSLYLRKKIKYNFIIKFIVSNLEKNFKDIKFNKFDEILKYINIQQLKYENL